MKYIFILTIIIHIPKIVISQEMIGLNNYLQADRVGLVDEFFARFNGIQHHPDIPLKSNDDKKKNLMMLFDLSQFTSTNDLAFKKASEMMDVVITNDIKINYPDSTWFALAHCLCKLENQEVRMDVYLTVERRNEKMYKWVISKVDGTSFNIISKNKGDMTMLYPDDHETNFISLSRMTDEQPFNVASFIRSNYKYDATSVFTWLVYKDKLKISYVEDLEFVFTEIPGYLFHLKYFNRDNSNSGWLISSFEQISDEEKCNLLQSLSFANNSSQFANCSPNNMPPSANTNEKVSIDEDSLSFPKRNIDHCFIFHKRLEELLSQMEDYIFFIQKKDTLKDLEFYCKKMQSLFDNDTKVILRDELGCRQSQVSTDDFCRLMLEQSITCLSIDSVSLPIWDKEIEKLGDDVEKVSLPAYRRPFKLQKLVELNPRTLTGESISIFKERTENGYEWIPLLGDLTVTVKRRDIEL